MRAGAAAHFFEQSTALLREGSRSASRRRASACATKRQIENLCGKARKSPLLRPLSAGGKEARKREATASAEDRAGVARARGVREDVLAGSARAGERAARRRGVVRVPGARADDDEPHAEGDPRDRARGGPADPFAHGRDRARGRIRRRLREVLRPPADGEELLFRDAGRAARGVPRTLHADRPRAREAVREAAAPAVRDRRGAGLLGRVADDGLLPARLARGGAPRPLLRQHEQARFAAALGDGGAVAAGGGAGSFYRARAEMALPDSGATRDKRLHRRVGVVFRRSDDIGLYRDLHGQFGQLSYEMWRAIRSWSTRILRSAGRARRRSSSSRATHRSRSTTSPSR